LDNFIFGPTGGSQT